MNNNAPESIESYKRQQLIHQSTAFHSALVNNQPVKTIPESTFVNEILPYYCGEATNAELPVLVAAAAGGPFLEFDVVDAQGNVLFRAPSLLAREMFDFKEFAKGQTASAIFMTADMLSNRSPRQAEAFISEQLTSKGLSKNAKEVYAKIIARRQEILQRYGKAVAGKDSTTSSNSSKNKPEIDYDDSELL